jgi:hypothetical protein
LLNPRRSRVELPEAKEKMFEDAIIDPNAKLEINDPAILSEEELARHLSQLSGEAKVKNDRKLDAEALTTPDEAPDDLDDDVEVETKVAKGPETPEQVQIRQLTSMVKELIKKVDSKGHIGSHENAWAEAMASGGPGQHLELEDKDWASLTGAYKVKPDCVAYKDIFFYQKGTMDKIRAYGDASVDQHRGVVGKGSKHQKFLGRT